MTRLRTYLPSLPERAVRATAAGVGGVAYEATELLLPGWLRQSYVYRATVARLLRVTIELVGGVAGLYPPDAVGVQELAVRKTLGNVIELASFLAVGWSPLWLLAIAADVTGGTRTYLRTLVTELERTGVLPEHTDVTSVEELLNILEQTSGAMADTIDVPPISVGQMRRSFQTLRKSVAQLPDASSLASIFVALQKAAALESRSLLEVSSLIALGAARAGIQMGSTYVFDYYRDALRVITTEGWSVYVKRVTRPYLTAVMRHFDPQSATHTERLLQRFRRRFARHLAETPRTPHPDPPRES